MTREWLEWTGLAGTFAEWAQKNGGRADVRNPTQYDEDTLHSAIRQLREHGYTVTEGEAALIVIAPPAPPGPRASSQSGSRR